MNALFKQAIAYFQQGNWTAAENAVTAALTQEPTNWEGWHMRGVLALQRAQPGEAVSHLRRAVGLHPNNVPMEINLAAALNADMRFDEALGVVTRVIAASPQSAEAHYQAGLSHQHLDNLPAAATRFTEAVRLRPDWPVALEMLANVLSHTGQHEKAAAHAQRALALDPGPHALCHRVLGDCYMRWLRYEEAEPHYKEALRIEPNNGLFRNNYALLLDRMGRKAESLAEYRAAVALEPKSVQAREAYATALLAAGRLEDGWRNYIARHRKSDGDLAQRGGPPAPAGPDQLKGASVLAWLDQGIGDQIMFSSLIPDLLATGADLTVECDPRLGPLLARSFPGLQTRRAENPAVPPGEGEFTYQVYGPDAARWFRNSFESFPRHAGYLRADPELTGQLRQRYKKHGDRPIVGISWRTAINTKVSAPKTLELADWAPILRERDATFVCLQYGNPWTEVGGAARMLGTDIVCDATIDPVKDIDAFASQVAAMDLVITTSNATAHMAGSLDIPVWTLVPMGYGGMWHWFLERSDSPWYPSMRLFRQTTRGDWMPVLAEAAAMLTHFLAARRK